MGFFGLQSSTNQKTVSGSKKSKLNPLFGSKGSELERLTTATLREAVKLPHGVDINEWLAINTVYFYKQIIILFATVGEFCTCPIMDAGSNYEYGWDTVSAPEYVEYLKNWIGTQIDDEKIFPQKPGAPFPPDFKDIVKRILKRLYRVYAHIYLSHFKKIVYFEAEAHLNTCFKSFVLFVTEFKLVDKIELDALKELVEMILDP